MSEQNEKNPIQFYTVCFPEYDSWTIFHGRLYQVRRDFFQSRLASQETIVDFSEGMPAKYTHSISRWGMRWKKKLDGQLREYSCFDPCGSAIIFQDSELRAYGKIVFGKDLNWLRSYYYEKGDTSGSPEKVRFELSGNPADNTITLTEYMDGQEPVTTRMLARPFFPGTVEQSLLNSKFGEPRICAATDQGDFCYYQEDLADRYDQWVARVHEGKEPLGPAWNADRELPANLEPDWYQEQDHQRKEEPGFSNLPPLEQLGSLRTQLFEPDLETEGCDGAPVCEPFSLEEESQDHWVEEMFPCKEPSDPENHFIQQKELDDFVAAGHPTPELDPQCYSANRELFHVEVPTEEPSEPVAQDVQEIMGMIDHMETTQKETAKAPELQILLPIQEETLPETNGTEIQEVDSRGMFPEGPMPARYTVAGKKRNSNVLRASDLFRKTDVPKEAACGPDETPMFPAITAAKRIVISAQESYYYFGKVVNGLRNGHGRTQTPDGQTAYEGHYRDDMRDGYGTYYYKSGKICYTGQWRDNQRDGIGVSFEPDKDSIQVGRWREDQLEGPSAVFDGQGNLEFAGKIENGERQGAGIAYSAEDGTVFVGKWKNNIPTGEGSAFDSDGNLIYSGSWKEGKRHGNGTEFAPDGRVIFKGEWKDDEYLNGVYYQRLEPSGGTNE